jgi:hypothetical protein
MVRQRTSTDDPLTIPADDDDAAATLLLLLLLLSLFLDIFQKSEKSCRPPAAAAGVGLCGNNLDKKCAMRRKCQSATRRRRR